MEIEEDSNKNKLNFNIPANSTPFNFGDKYIKQEQQYNNNTYSGYNKIQNHVITNKEPIEPRPCGNINEYFIIPDTSPKDTGPVFSFMLSNTSGRAMGRVREGDEKKKQW